MKAKTKLGFSVFWLRATILIFLLFKGSAFAATVPQPVVVTMHDDYFSPAMLYLSPGQTVTWVNEGHKVHTVTSKRGYFKSGRIQPGERFSYTFTQPGTYYYYCSLHSFLSFGMRGKVVVQQP